VITKESYVVAVANLPVDHTHVDVLN